MTIKVSLSTAKLWDTYHYELFNLYDYNKIDIEISKELNKALNIYYENYNTFNLEIDTDSLDTKLFKEFKKLVKWYQNKIKEFIKIQNKESK